MLLLCGCAVVPSGAGRPWEAWAQRQGGLSADAAQQCRAAVAAERVARGTAVTPRVYVLASDRLAAFSWTGGDVFVTDGLLRALDDEELAAAIAHELGHLIDAGAPDRAAGLDGNPHVGDAEERADRIACELLCQCGIPPGALGRALAKVSAGQDARSVRRALAARIELIGAHVVPTPFAPSHHE